MSLHQSLCLCILVLSSVGVAQSDKPSSIPVKPISRVLFVAFGGLRGDVLPKVSTPNLDSLRKSGGYSDHCLAVLPTENGPTWTSMLTGQGPSSHGVKENDLKGWRPNIAPALPTLLQLSGYPGKFYSVTQNDAMARLLFDAHESLHREKDDDIESEAQRLLEFENPGVLFVQFNAAEKAGSRFGYEIWSPLYRSAFVEFDQRLGKLCHSLRQRPGYAHENWMVIVTANHGGHGRKAGTAKESDRRVFLLLTGKNIAPGMDLGETYQVDVVPTLLGHLGVTVPDSLRLTGTPRGPLNPLAMDGLTKTPGQINRPQHNRPSTRYSGSATFRMAR
jgi:arylsulfatase A-like enzyme